MREEVATLPANLKAAYEEQRQSIMDMALTKQQRALALANLDAFSVEVHSTIKDIRKPDPVLAELPRHVVPVIQTGHKLMVDARTLHNYLDVGRDFQTWFKDRVEKYGWVEGEDYFVVLEETLLPKFGEQKDARGGHNAVDYHLTLSMAKELGMVENNEMGRAIRKNFLDCEQRLVEVLNHKNAELRLRIDTDLSNLDWLRDKTVDKFEDDALLVWREMWEEERQNHLDHLSGEWKEAKIGELGRASDLARFLRKKIKSAVASLNKVHKQAVTHRGLNRDSVILSRLEGVIEDFEFVDLWLRSK